MEMRGPLDFVDIRFIRFVHIRGVCNLNFGYFHRDEIEFDFDCCSWLDSSEYHGAVVTDLSLTCN